MTTKLANFKTFLQKAKKPCVPGKHRHWGYDYCHPSTSVHHKHNKMGIDPHHGMDEFGQIPNWENVLPPGAEEHHHLAKPHGEKTGSTGGNCSPVEYPKGSGKIVPAHRHFGSDYCHPITQKHGASAPDGAAWHETHQADIEQSWKLFNDQQGLEGDTTPGTFDQDAIDDVVPDAPSEEVVPPEPAPFEVPSPGTVDNPQNLQVGNIITYPDMEGTLEIESFGEFEDNPFVYAKDMYGDTYNFTSDDPNISVVDAQAGLPTGDVVNPLNPHDLQVGTKLTYPISEEEDDVLLSGGATQLEITGIDMAGDSITFNSTPVNADNVPSGQSWDSSMDVDTFNLWLTTMLTDSTIDILHPGINDIPTPQSPSIPTGTTDDPYTEEYLNTIPKLGESVSDLDTLVSFPPGTQFMSENGQVITLLEVQQGLNADGNEVLTNYHLNLGELGDMWFNGDEWPSGFGKIGYEPTVLTLPSDVSSAMDKNFQLGGSIIPSNLNLLPVGLVFTVAGQTLTVTENDSAAFKNVKPGTGIKVSMVDENGTTFDNIDIGQDILDAIGNNDEVVKIVALPSGITSQQTTEKAPAFNKNGLDKGTKVDIKSITGYVSKGTITKTNKLKAGGYNYIIEGKDENGELKQVKVASKDLEDPESENAYGYFVTEALHKEGMEPDVDPLELPPLGSEPGNFDDVLEQVGGQLGYNEGGTFKHKQTGKQFYIKFSSSGNDEQVKSEALANNLYELLGIGTLGTSLISFKGKTALKSDWNPNLETIPIGQMSKEAGIMDSFVADAWLANWDVIGPQNDNTQKSGDKIIKIDSGGALKFGGAGGAKPFTATVNELETLRDPTKAKVAYKVFQDITNENLVTGAQKLAKVTDAHIDAIVNNSQISNKENMKEVLKARRDAIVGKVLNESHTAASEGLLHPGQHKHEGGKGWHAEGLEHSGKKANEAHEKLGLPFTAPKKYIGSTLEPGQDFFSVVANSTTIPAQYKTLINKALAIDFNETKSVQGRRARIQNFLTENNIADKFSENFGNWQGGGYYTGNIRVAAALFELKGEAAAVRESQANHWGWTMQQTHHFEESWDSGTADALSIIPYVVASQQYVKSMHTGQFTVQRGLADRKINPIGSQVKNAMSLVADNKKKDWVGQFPGGSPAVAAGWSENLATAKKFGNAGSNGVVFKKRIKAEDVLLHFKAFSDSYTSEEEVIIDPNSARKFSYDEILLSGIDY